MAFSLLAASQFVPDIFGGGRPVSADQILEQYVYVFCAAFVVAFVFTPVMRAVATYYGIIDEPDRIRKMHSVPVAYLGGVAVFLGWLSGLAISQFRPLPVREPGLPAHVTINFSIVAGAAIIIVLGLWDDIFKVRPWVKIGGQVAAALFLLSDNVGAKCTNFFFYHINGWLRKVHDSPGSWMSRLTVDPIQLPDWMMYMSSSVVVIAVVVACCNATNLMDGLDGLCSGVTAIIAGGFLFLAVHLAMFGGSLDPNLDAMRVVIAIALLGAVMGFIPYNFNPASIFMGDTGSMFLGYCCAVMIILMSQQQHWRWFLAAMVVFALPVLDTALAMARRWVNKRPIFAADHQHFHHQLVARGLSVKRTVLISYGLALFFAVGGCLIAVIRTRYAVAAYLIIFGYIIVAAYKMGMVHEKPRVVTRRDITDAVDEEAADAAVTVSREIQPGTVLEVRDRASAADAGQLKAGT
jgi:UDP-GlcNAc:undecaprenyl-phosphate GlcNAc-1-phosphate transferase